MGRPKLYVTPEARAEAKRRWRQTSAERERLPEFRARRKAQKATPEARAKATARYARYRATEKYQAVQTRYAASQRGKATEAAYQAWQKAIHPIRIKARAAVSSALRKGTILRPFVCSCGRTARLDAHHALGYEPTHWLDVIWLCRKCHKAAHA